MCINWVHQCHLSRREVSSCRRACGLQEPEEGAGDLWLTLASVPALLIDFVQLLLVNLVLFF